MTTTKKHKKLECRFSNVLVVPIVLFLLFVSCDEIEIEKELVGKWKLHSWTAEKPVDINKDGISTTDVLKELKDCTSAIYVFEENEKFNWITIGGTYTDEFGEIIKNDCEPVTFFGKYALDETNKILNLHFEGGPFTGQFEPSVYNIDIKNDKLYIYKDLGISLQPVSEEAVWATGEYWREK